MRPSRQQLDQARRESRGARAAFGETADGVWHRLVPDTYAARTAVIACVHEGREVRRLATDLPERDVTCPACRDLERKRHVG